MAESDEDLPLPSFVELFGEGITRKRRRRDHEETSGRWTSEEHRLFLEGVMLYGKDWKKMQPLIKTRSLVQIRTHAQKVFQKVGQRRQSGEAREESAEDVEEARQQDEEEEKEEREEAETHPAGHIEVSTASNGNSSSNEASSTSSSHFDMGDISDCYANKPAAAAAAAM